MTTRIALGLLTLMLMIGGCATKPEPRTHDAGPDMDRLHQWLTGKFETRGRAGTPVWHMRAVPIIDDEPGRWIHVTQWRDSPDGPERRFVYHLVESGARFIALDLYTVTSSPDHPVTPETAPPTRIDRDDLKRRRGCRIQLTPDGLSYVGGTRGRDCPTDYRGAARLRIELTVREREIREWLQGFDADGDRLWSAEDVGRIYRRTGQP